MENTLRNRCSHISGLLVKTCHGLRALMKSALPLLSVPEKVDKFIPAALTRAVSRAVRRANNRIARRTCRQEFPGIIPDPDQALQCDEYPFASTYEGAAKGDNNFSVLPVPAVQNTRAGRQLNTWYQYDRILDRDVFSVEITP